MKQSSFHWAFLSVGLLLVFTTIGCGPTGPAIAEVEGQVLMNGQPLPGATVTFEPPGARPSVGVTDEQGRYQLLYSTATEGALVGEHVVRISTFQPSVPAGPNGEMTEMKPELVPDKYNEDSELTVVVEDSWGAQEHDFELEADASS